MPQSFATMPVQDSVAKVNQEVAVGEDLEFQHRWWKFEKGVWIVFSLLLVMDVLGLLGRGWLAKQQRSAADGSMHTKYERIQRTSTPSILTINFSESAIHDGQVQLFVSESVVKELGAQRVVPAPKETSIGNGGLTYTFPATAPPASVEIAMEPTGPGLRHFVLQVPGMQPIKGDVVVVP